MARSENEQTNSTGEKPSWETVVRPLGSKIASRHNRLTSWIAGHAASPVRKVSLWRANTLPSVARQISKINVWNTNVIARVSDLSRRIIQSKRIGEINADSPDMAWFDRGKKIRPQSDNQTETVYSAEQEGFSRLGDIAIPTTAIREAPGSDRLAGSGHTQVQKRQVQRVASIQSSMTTGRKTALTDADQFSRAQHEKLHKYSIMASPGAVLQSKGMQPLPKQAAESVVPKPVSAVPEFRPQEAMGRLSRSEESSIRSSHSEASSRSAMSAEIGVEKTPIESRHETDAQLIPSRPGARSITEKPSFVRSISRKAIELVKQASPIRGKRPSSVQRTPEKQREPVAEHADATVESPRSTEGVDGVEVSGREPYPGAQEMVEAPSVQSKPVERVVSRRVYTSPIPLSLSFVSRKLRPSYRTPSVMTARKGKGKQYAGESEVSLALDGEHAPVVQKFPVSQSQKEGIQRESERVQGETLDRVITHKYLPDDAGTFQGAAESLPLLQRYQETKPEIPIGHRERETGTTIHKERDTETPVVKQVTGEYAAYSTKRELPTLIQRVPLFLSSKAGIKGQPQTLLDRGLAKTIDDKYKPTETIHRTIPFQSVSLDRSLSTEDATGEDETTSFSISTGGLFAGYTPIEMPGRKTHTADTGVSRSGVQRSRSLSGVSGGGLEISKGISGSDLELSRLPMQSIQGDSYPQSARRGYEPVDMVLAHVKTTSRGGTPTQEISRSVVDESTTATSSSQSEQYQSGDGSQAEGTDTEVIARQVYAIVRRRLAVERERAGYR